MINFDARLEWKLYAAIYGGAPLTLRQQRAVLKHFRLKAPLQVTALNLVGWSISRIAALQQIARRGGATLLTLHPGMGYLLSPDTRLPARFRKQRRIAAGAALRCGNPGELIRMLQLAIVSLRKIEHRALIARHANADAAAESALRAAAVREILSARREWPRALRAWTDVVLARHHGALNAIRRKMVEFYALVSQPFDTHPRINALFVDALRHIFATYAIGEFRTLLPELVRELLPYMRGREQDLTALPERTPPLVRAAADFMRQSSARPISLVDVAEAVHVSPAHLSRQFRAATGRTLTHYLQALRIQRAQAMLASGGEGTLQIALSCGFNSPEHFFRTFRALTGTTPKQYRRTAAV